MTKLLRESVHLPGLLAEIADEAGLPAALAIAREKGGARAYIPARAPDDHWLARCVGREAADKVCAHFAASGRGIELLIPIGPAGNRGRLVQSIYLMLDQKRSAADIARELGIHERTARRHRKKHGSKRQPDLLDQLKD